VSAKGVQQESAVSAPRGLGTPLACDRDVFLEVWEAGNEAVPSMTVHSWEAGKTQRAVFLARTFDSAKELKCSGSLTASS